MTPAEIDPNDESVGVDSDTQASSKVAPTTEAKSKTPSACNSRTDSTFVVCAGSGLVRPLIQK
jgi:hypothetical protein